ncbi:hypothetical protein [Flavobacterium sp. XS2P39]|uniref:hypothetical protein n=1 Tax=Flavobacterium sp. XS2P39 TaxID=3401725 RepID=UPI003AAAB46E
MNDKSLDGLINQLTPLFIQIQHLHEEAYHIYKPQVEDLIKTQTKDGNTIERHLDYLLDHCGNEKVLELFKKLCRYYWDIDPRATADYILIYKEHWDDDHLISEEDE